MGGEAVRTPLTPGASRVVEAWLTGTQQEVYEGLGLEQLAADIAEVPLETKRLLVDFPGLHGAATKDGPLEVSDDEYWALRLNATFGAEGVEVIMDMSKHDLGRLAEMARKRSQSPAETLSQALDALAPVSGSVARYRSYEAENHLCLDGPFVEEGAVFVLESAAQPLVSLLERAPAGGSPSWWAEREAALAAWGEP